MSDFLYSSAPQPAGRLSRLLQAIHHAQPPEITEFHGAWGCAAVSRNDHVGFSPLETERHLLVVIGAPALMFTSNTFLAGNDATYGARLLHERMLSRDGVAWDRDVSGPFAVLRVDKLTAGVDIVTDLLSFIPVYSFQENGFHLCGTHVDTVARASPRATFDTVSIADFILHGVVTYPHTAYAGVYQLAPATHHRYANAVARPDTSTYWLPLESNRYAKVDDAADELREGIDTYIRTVCEGLDEVALLLSGGEDARTVLGMLPRRCRRHAFVFLDQMNREGRVAQAAAKAYDASMTIALRAPDRYLSVLPACADLVGTGAEYSHAHSYGFRATEQLRRFPAVFGGYLADTFFKGYYIPATRNWRPSIGRRIFNTHTSDALGERIDAHLRRLAAARGPESAGEWFAFWPMSMRSTAPHFWSNRRLFRSYEPFMAAASVKVAAGARQEWKLDRLLFQKMARPALRATRFLFHANGWLPYFPWSVNRYVKPLVLRLYELQERLGLTQGNQGPWNDWKQLMQGAAWQKVQADLLAKESVVHSIFLTTPQDALKRAELSGMQTINLLQIMHQCQRVGWTYLLRGSQEDRTVMQACGVR